MINTLLSINSLGGANPSGAGVQGISLSLAVKSIGVLVGGPRSGKSTLLRIISGELPVNSGSVRLGGVDVTTMPVWKRRQKGLALVSQDPPRFDHLSAEQQICLGLGKRLLPAKHKNLLFQHLPEVDGLLSTPMHQLSRQAHRLIDLASALVLLPGVMLLDEPAVDFGPDRAIELAKSLNAADITLLIADRYAAPMLEIADQAWALERGRMLAQGSPEQLRTDPNVQAACLGDGQLD